MATKRTTRPFQEWDPDSPYLPGPNNPPVCGAGKETQIDIHSSLFDTPAASSPLYFRELVSLTRQLNTVFRRSSAVALRKKRKEWGIRSMQLTLALSRGRLYLVYAVPKRKRRAKRKAGR